jgi:L-methionine (R)-S-oxide reductase
MELLLKQVRVMAAADANRDVRAGKIAAGIRAYGGYRWVGVYDVREGMVSIVAWSGPSAPVYPTFPATQGLTSAAIREKATIVANDVSSDARYLTAFGSTRAEIIVPLIAPDGTVVGTIDVESESAGAFSSEDQTLLEQCAQAALPLWVPDPTRQRQPASRDC